MIKRCVVTLILCLLCAAQTQTALVHGKSKALGRVGFDVNPNITVNSIAVTPVNQQQFVGLTVGYTANVTLSTGSIINVTKYSTWSVSNTSIAQLLSLTDTENIKCISGGTVEVKAVYGGLSNSTHLTCNPTVPPAPVLQSITLSPLNPNIAVGTSQGFSAIGHFSDGSSQDITATSTWTSSNNTIASPGTLGVQEPFNCLKGGTITVTATDPPTAIFGTTNLTCNPVLTSISITPLTASILVGSTQGYLATCLFNDGSSGSCTLNATWTSSNTAVASMASPVVAPEVATGLTAGTVTITAAIGTISNTATLTVNNPGPPPPTLTSVTVNPQNQTINVGGTLNYTATCNYSDGSTVDCTAGATWVSTSPGVATISGSGDPRVATGVSAGTTNIHATFNAVLGTTGLTVQTPAPTLTSIAVTPANQTVNVGSIISYTATCTYSDGSTQNCTLQATWTSSNTGVATRAFPVTSPEPVTCVAPGSTTISAQISSTTGTTGLTCQNPIPPGSGNDAYAAPGNVCNFGANDSYAALPQTCYYTNPSSLPSPGTVRHVTTASALTVALAAMACGDITSVDASFTGQFTLPSLHCDSAHYWAIKGFGISSLPPYGTKVNPCYANVVSIPGYVTPNSVSVYPCSSPTSNMPTITTTGGSGTGAVFKVPAAGFSFGVVEGLVFARNTGGLITDLAVDTSTGGRFDHFVLYKNWFKGNPADETNRVMVLNRCTYCAVIDNFASELHCISGTGACTDAKFIGGGTNSNAGDTDNTWKIVNNFAASAAECLLSGGAAAVITPSDIEERNNYCFKPPSWNPACTVALCGAAYSGGVSGHPYLVKNCIEFKNVNRVLVEGNYCQDGWAGFSQVGAAFLITPKNQSGTLCPLCFTNNVTIRFNWVQSYWQFFQLANVSDGSGTFATSGHSYSVHDNLAEHMQYSACYQCQTSASTMTMFNDPTAPTSDILNSVDLNHNTFIMDATASSFSSYLMGVGSAVSPNNNFNMKWQNNIFPVGHFGGFNSSIGASGCASGQIDASGMITSCWANNTVSGNVIVPPMSIRASGGVPKWPVGQCQLIGTGSGNFGGLTGAAAYAALFTTYNNGIGGVYSLNPASKCHNQGNDGLDPGVQWSTLLNRIQYATAF